MVNNPPPSEGDARDVGLIPGLGRSPGVGNCNPLRYSFLNNPVDRRDWRTTVQGVTKNCTRLSNRACAQTHTQTHTHRHTHTHTHTHTHGSKTVVTTKQDPFRRREEWARLGQACSNCLSPDRLRNCHAWGVSAPIPRHMGQEDVGKSQVPRGLSQGLGG